MFSAGEKGNKILKCFDILFQNHISVYYLPTLQKEVKHPPQKKINASTVNTKVNEWEGILLENILKHFYWQPCLQQRAGKG